jgi:uncharacterized protein YgbK (DUF1537 family)
MIGKTDSRQLEPVRLSSFLKDLPPEWQGANIAEEINRLSSLAGRKVVVLDDDPTGTQTVHGVKILTVWDLETIKSAISGREGIFYILTNSRAYPQKTAVEINEQIAHSIAKSCRELRKSVDIVSRSDSTLRGHYPAELEPLYRVLEPALGKFDAEIIIPAFFEGGRFTAHDIHWVIEGECAVPVGETEFAHDPVFGYKSSNLRSWIEEKTGGCYPAERVISITLDDMRMNGPDGVYAKLCGADRGSKYIVNAATYRDIEVFVLGLLRAEIEGKRFLFRSGASFVKVRGCIKTRDLLKPDEILAGCEHIPCGLIVVGSHVSRTSRQLQHLLEHITVAGIEIDVRSVLNSSTYEREVRRVEDEVNDFLQQGKDVVIYTSREVQRGINALENLDISQRVSQAVADVVASLKKPLRYLIAKGGITASDISTKALCLKQARVIGQILPGVPVWKLGEHQVSPNLAYVIFPGNVGTEDSLTQVVTALRLHTNP